MTMRCKLEDGRIVSVIVDGDFDRTKLEDSAAIIVYDEPPAAAPPGTRAGTLRRQEYGLSPFEVRVFVPRDIVGNRRHTDSRRKCWTVNVEFGFKRLEALRSKLQRMQEDLKEDSEYGPPPDHRERSREINTLEQEVRQLEQEFAIMKGG